MIITSAWSRQVTRWLGRVYERSHASHLLCSRFSCKPKMTLFRVSDWASVVDNICKILIFVTWSSVGIKICICIKFHWNQMICGQDVAIKPFTKWRQSAVLNFLNLLLVKRPVSNMIVFPHTKFRINRTINRWDIAINDFQYGGRPPFWMCKFWYFVTWPFLERASASAHQI